LVGYPIPIAETTGPGRKSQREFTYLVEESNTEDLKLAHDIVQDSIHLAVVIK
jgi:hypothetical protein